MGRQLASFGSNTYTYNENGIRTSKTVNGNRTTYYLDETNIIEQITGDTVLHFYYDSNDEIIGFEYTDDNYYYVKNAMSDIVGIVDNSGNLIVRYAYDPYGKVLSISGNAAIGNINPFRYKSYYYDSDTELYYLQSRYYDPETSRFINCDDVDYIGINDTFAGWNGFAYCENEPIGSVDFNGNSFIDQLKSLLSKVKSLFVKDTISVLTISDGRWFESSENIGENFRSAAGAKSCTTIAINHSNFKSNWDGLNSKYVIIHSHGSSTGLFDDKKPQNTILTTSDIVNLKKNTKIKCVIILACSVAGTTSNNADNVARAFSRRIDNKGVVVGCRFTLTGGDNEFYVDTKKVGNVSNPWNIYRNGAFINNTMQNRVTMRDIYTFLKNNKYI